MPGGKRCTTRRVRYLLVTGGLGTDLQTRRHGQTRLFGVLDVMFMRLAIRLESEGVSPWLVRVILTYLRNDLVRAFRAASPLALAVRGIQGSLEPALKNRPTWAVAFVPLRDTWQGVESEFQKIIEARDEVWMWSRVPVRTVPRGTA